MLFWEAASRESDTEAQRKQLEDHYKSLQTKSFKRLAPFMNSRGQVQMPSGYVGEPEDTSDAGMAAFRERQDKWAQKQDEARKTLALLSELGIPTADDGLVALAKEVVAGKHAPVLPKRGGMRADTYIDRVVAFQEKAKEYKRIQAEAKDFLDYWKSVGKPE